MSKKTTKVAAAASAPFQAADHLRTDAEIAAYVESMLEDGDPRAVPVALRTVAEAAGGMQKAEEIMARYRKTLRVLAK